MRYNPLKSFCTLCFFPQICEVLLALKLVLENDDGPFPPSMVRPVSPSEGDTNEQDGTDWLLEELDEDDSAGEDSDEDSLCNKLCTYTHTQKEFMNQHW